MRGLFNNTKNKWGQNTLTVTVCLVFMFSTISAYLFDFAQAQSNTFGEWATNSTIDDFELPENSGEIKYRYSGASGKTIIHIQDAH
ncbi:MAG: hypothetical protein ABH883_01995, partial [Candidatus Omnitrophota bacterium]